MRLKLLIIVSLVAAAIGSGASVIAIVVLSSHWARPLGAKLSGGWTSVLIYLPPLLVAMLASVFIYRHTARQRKMQAALTAIAVLFFCVLTLIVISRYFLHPHLSY
jgi:hypothetical protein